MHNYIVFACNRTAFGAFWLHSKYQRFLTFAAMTVQLQLVDRVDVSGWGREFFCIAFGNASQAPVSFQLGSAGIIWYHILVTERGQQWQVKKTYHEFLHLDAMLSTSPFARPPLPEQGRTLSSCTGVPRIVFQRTCCQA